LLRCIIQMLNDAMDRLNWTGVVLPLILSAQPSAA
jgi:hypothetical protein